MRRPQRATWLAGLLGGSGVLHLVRPQAYDWLVPPELGNPRVWVTGSGLAELGTAALLAGAATRRAGGWAAAGLLLGFVPAHLHSLRVLRDKPGPLAVAALRLPVQVPLVRAALAVARGSVR